MGLSSFMEYDSQAAGLLQCRTSRGCKDNRQPAGLPLVFRLKGSEIFMLRLFYKYYGVIDSNTCSLRGVKLLHISKKIEIYLPLNVVPKFHSFILSRLSFFLCKGFLCRYLTGRMLRDPPFMQPPDVYIW